MVKIVFKFFMLNILNFVWLIGKDANLISKFVLQFMIFLVYNNKKIMMISFFLLLLNANEGNFDSLNLFYLYSLLIVWII